MRPKKSTLDQIRISSRSAFRRATQDLRALPGLVVVGAQKCGTTSMYHYLSQHPKLSPSSKKEVHYFDNGVVGKSGTYERGEKWYRRHFHLQARQGVVSFEISPEYLLNPMAAGCIAKDLPGVKIVAVLRDPVDRAISQYKMEFRRKNETLTCTDAMLAEEERLVDSFENQIFNTPNFIWHTYKLRGRYFEQLKRYAELFDEKDLLVLEFGEINKPETYDRITDLVGLDRHAFDVGRVYHKAESKPSAPKNADPCADARAYLTSYFRPHNEQLFEWLGREFDWQR